MKEKQRNIKPYLVVGALVLLIFGVLFYIKGIYPFGPNSLIWGDMHDQVTAFYYHFYDCFHGNVSLFIDFTTSGGINFLGILSYYLASPVSFLILLFPRHDIYLAVSILIVVKILLSSWAALYFIRRYFKDSPHYLSVLLALLYAFSGYQLLNYQITAWIDIVYLFPILMIGLKKVLDGESPLIYIFCLGACFIFSFYLTTLLAIFLVLVSAIYLYCFHAKEKHGKAILQLGLSTVFALLLSSFLLFPSLSQLSVSSRVGFDLENLMNSKFGPLNDKLCLFITAGFSIVGTILLFFKGYKNKEHHKILYFYGIILILLLLPIIVEPINKMNHLGSYAFFPQRIGFVTLFLMLIGTIYYFTKIAKEKEFPKKRIPYAFLITIISSLVAIVITCVRYGALQKEIYKISLGKDVWTATTLMIIMLVLALGIFLVLKLNNFNYDKKTFFFIWILVLVNIGCCSLLYFGIDFAQEDLTGVYQDMETMGTTYQDKNFKRVKSIYPKLVMNHGMVTKFPSIDHFTSLTDKENMQFLKRLGYSSYWVKTYSIGGTLFSDALLANQYLISKEPYESPYYNYISYQGSILFYEHKNSIPYGYFIDHEVDIPKEANAFEMQNTIYQSITGSKDNIFEIDKTLWQKKNLYIYKDEEEDDYLYYHIRHDGKIAYLEKTITVKDKKDLYLELMFSIENEKNKEILEHLNIYVNGKLFRASYPEEIDNGLLDLGIYENEDVTIRLEFEKTTPLKILEIGMMDVAKYEEFISNEGAALTIDFANNQVNVKVQGEEGKILFLPITYNKGYQVEVNGKPSEVLCLYDNYLGVKVEDGLNEITFTYTSPGFKAGLLLSVVTILAIIVLFKTNLYTKIVSSNFLQKIALYLYRALYLVLLVAIYLVPFIGFIISFFVHLKY